MSKQTKDSARNEIVSLATDAGTGVLSLIEPVTGVIAATVSSSIRKASDIRAKHFLSKFDSLLQSSDESDIADCFEKLQNSDAISEMLMDYVRAAIMSPSPLARTALAIIYYKYYKTDEEPDFFTKTSMNALSHVTDEELLAFIDLTDLDSIGQLPKPENSMTLDDSGPYPVIFFQEPFKEHICNATGLNEDEIVTVIHRLINFNILQSDYAVGRYGGVTCPYGVNQYALRLRKIFMAAKEHCS